MTARTPRRGRSAPKIWWWITDYAYATWRQAASLMPAPVRKQRQREQQPPAATTSLTLLVLPGVYERWGFMRPLALRLQSHGHSVHVIRELGWNTQDIDESAAVVARYCTTHHLTTVAIVAHSKGGLIGKHLILHHSDTVHVAAMIAIATPFSGSRYARWLPVRTLRHFSRTHPALAALTTQRDANERITSVFAHFDPHIPERSELVGATNHEIPTGGHFRILANHTALAHIDQWGADLTAPRSGL